MKEGVRLWLWIPLLFRRFAGAPHSVSPEARISEVSSTDVSVLEKESDLSHYPTTFSVDIHIYIYYNKCIFQKYIHI